VRFDAPPPSRASYLFAEPYDGAAVLMEMHDVLNPTPGHEPFDPHITVGLFERAAEAEQVARIVERQHLPMHGRVEELALLSRDGDKLETLASHRLG
jgi:2'-5' RNA ligase superfamily